MKGVPPWLVHWACRAGKGDFCSALGSSLPTTKYFIPRRTQFNSFVLIAQQAGKPAVLGRLSLNICMSLVILLGHFTRIRKRGMLIVQY
jgi:hypothetical protein